VPDLQKGWRDSRYEASGGGFAEYVRVMDWIVRKGVIRLPDDVSFEQHRSSSGEHLHERYSNAGLNQGETVL